MGLSLKVTFAHFAVGIMEGMNGNLVVENVGGEPYEYLPLGEHIVQAGGVCGGRPTFKYTRVEVSGVLDRLERGDSITQIVEAYRGRIPAEAVSEAIVLYCKRPQGLRYSRDRDTAVEAGKGNGKGCAAEG